MEPLVDHEQRIGVLERQLRELRTRIRGPRVVAWTPTLYQNGALIASTVSDSFCVQSGGLYYISARHSLTANSGATGQIEVHDLPLVTAFDRSFSGGAFTFYDTSAAVHHVGTVRGGAGTGHLFFTVENVSANLGATPSFTLGIGDGFSYFCLIPAEAIS